MKKYLWNYKLWLFVLIIVHTVAQVYTKSAGEKILNEIHFIAVCIWVLIFVYADKKPPSYNFSQVITVPKDSDVTSDFDETKNAN
jgi:hypothetical protein